MPEQTPYGVDWPEWADLTPEGERTSGSKFDTNMRQTKKELGTEFDRMDAERWNIDYESGSGGFPGVVARWTVSGVDHAIACDAHRKRRANLREVYLWVNENRLSANRPVDTGQDQFAAAELPSGDEEDALVMGAKKQALDAESAAKLLGVRTDATEDQIRGAAERMIRSGHPDQGGTADVAEIKEARDVLLED